MENQNPVECVIDVPRNFSGVYVKKVVEMAKEKLAQGETGFVLDFSRAESIDSCGIGQLVGIAKVLKEKGLSLKLRNLNEDINGLFKETGLDQLFVIEGQKQEVVDLFGTSVDIRLNITFEEVGDICVFKMEGVMDHIGFDSLSVGTVLDMHKLLSKTGGQMKMCGANFLIEDLFTTLNLNVVIPYFPTRTEAIAGWK
jgi:anti-anti-sigma factor